MRIPLRILCAPPLTYGLRALASLGNALSATTGNGPGIMSLTGFCCGRIATPWRTVSTCPLAVQCNSHRSQSTGPPPPRLVQHPDEC